MKHIINIILAAGMTLAATACSDDDTVGVADAGMQATTGYFSSGESYKADIYYKPYVGYVGDPMPFFDPQSQTFRILYLQDMRDGNSVVYHPIHQLETADAASYTGGEEAIACGGAAEDDPAIGTGSTIFAGGKYYTFYTGHKAASPREVILRATSDDCRHWTKDRAFRMEAPEGYNRDEFRDPYVFFDDEAGVYRMVVATLLNGRSVLAQFTSEDLAHWTETEPFFFNKWGRFYECPDVFRMGDWWYLVYSDKDITRQVQYFYARTLRELMTMGDDPQFPWRDEGKLEGTSFYAGKTASDGTNRYIWGWCATRQGNLPEGTADWAGSLVVHKLVQNADGTLGLACPDGVMERIGRQGAVVEMDRKGEPDGSVASGYTLSAGDEVRFSRLGYQNRIEFDVEVADPHTAVFGIALADCSDRDYSYRIYIEDRWNNLKYDRRSLDSDGNELRRNINAFGFISPDDGRYHVTMTVDQSVCVVYVNGQYAFTNRVYGMQRNPWSLFCSDGSVKISNVKLFDSTR